MRYISFDFHSIEWIKRKEWNPGLSVPHTISTTYAVLRFEKTENSPLLARRLTWAFNILQSQNCPSLKCAFRKCVFFGNGGTGGGKITTISWVWVLALKAFEERGDMTVCRKSKWKTEAHFDGKATPLKNNRNHFHHRSSSFFFACTHGNSNNKIREAKRIIFEVDKIHALPFCSLLIIHGEEEEKKAKSSSVTTIFYLPLCTISHFPIKSLLFALIRFQYVCVCTSLRVSFRSRRSLESLNRTQIIWMLTFIHSFSHSHQLSASIASLCHSAPLPFAHNCKYECASANQCTHTIGNRCVAMCCCCCCFLRCCVAHKTGFILVLLSV